MEKEGIDETGIDGFMRDASDRRAGRRLRDVQRDPGRPGAVAGAKAAGADWSAPFEYYAGEYYLNKAVLEAEEGDPKAGEHLHEAIV